MAKRAALKQQVGALWQQAVHQLDDVKKVVKLRSGRLEADVARLKMERDKLLTLLGEQTYKLANQELITLPALVQRTVVRLNEVVTMLAPQSNGHTHEAMSDDDHADTLHAEAPAKKRAPRTRAPKKAKHAVSKTAN